MALGYNEIDYVRSNISRVSTDNSKIKESSETFNYVMNNEEFRKFVKEIDIALKNLKGRMSVLSETDVLSSMGFPNDWKEQLLL